MRILSRMGQMFYTDQFYYICISGDATLNIRLYYKLRPPPRDQHCYGKGVVDFNLMLNAALSVKSGIYVKFSRRIFIVSSCLLLFVFLKLEIIEAHI